jgi:hypothetical protein
MKHPDNFAVCSITSFEMLQYTCFAVFVMLQHTYFAVYSMTKEKKEGADEGYVSPTE